jgi:hypothetical protein
MSVNSELEGMLKDAVMAYFKVLAPYFAHEIDEDHEIPNSG